MIYTITTATISTITTDSLAGSFALVGILVLFVLLVQKELAGSSSSIFMLHLRQVVDVAVFPLFIAFLLIVIFKVAEVLH